MRTLTDAAHPGRPAATRIVMLPAAYSSAEDFVREGFASAVRARGLDIDLVFTPLQLEHVTDRSVLGRVHREIVQPARAQHAAVWLGGISLGAYIALCYAAEHARELTGLCLFAPYLGSHIITGEIERAGGARAWDAGAVAADDEERRVWRFIKQRPAALALHLGLGREDRFAPRHRLLAQVLPAQAVDCVPGGHDWPTWGRLWENFLDARFAHGHG